MHSDIIKEYEKHRNHSPVIMLLCQPNTREGDYIRINGAITITNYPGLLILTFRLQRMFLDVSDV